MAAPLPDPIRPPPRGTALRGVLLGVAGLAVLAAGAWLGLREVPPPAGAPLAPAAAPAQVAAVPPAVPAPAPLATPSAAPSTAAPAPAIAAAPAAAPPAVPAPAPAVPVVARDAPRFDIVRVSPAGSMVAAGRAEPGAEVILRANGQEIGRVRADAQGQWAFAGAAPLAPGAHEITLAVRDPSGRETAGTGSVEAVVAAPSAPPAVAAPATAPAASPGNAPVVVLTTPQGGPVLLQAPGRPVGNGRLGLDIVDYDAGGDIRFAGTAPPGATIRLYVDDAHVGDAIAGADGRWSLAPAGAVAQGEHRLRLDQVDGAGRVAARVEQPFQRAAVAALEAGVQRVVVQPRQNLWRIARRAYGQGVRYTEIYAANRDVISDPARIYPGQVFAIPGAAAPAGASTPASASRSR